VYGCLLLLQDQPEVQDFQAQQQRTSFLTWWIPALAFCPFCFFAFPNSDRHGGRGEGPAGPRQQAATCRGGRSRAHFGTQFGAMAFFFLMLQMV